jgi:hypothetical protein
MRLSEAIRLGAMLRPQCRGDLAKTFRTGLLGLFGPKVTGSCALGAAFEAAECLVERRIVQGSPAIRGSTTNGEHIANVVKIPAEWYAIMYSSISCPECSTVEVGFRLIPHLNDDHDWTRERIADFVQAFELPVPKDGADAALAASPEVTAK